MSELEDIAAELRSLAESGNRAQQLVAAMSREISSMGSELASMNHLLHLSGAREALDALSSARARAADAGASIQALESGAESFADRLVGGGGAKHGVLSALEAAATAAAVAIGIAGAERALTPAHTDRTIAEIEEALPAFNPKAPEDFDPQNEYLNNCGKVAANVFRYLEGKKARAAGKGTLTDPQMDRRTGLRTTIVASSDEIVARLRAAGPGSHAVVGILRERGYGHWFNVFFDGEKVYTIDGQPHGGLIDDFPSPHGENVRSWDLSL